MGGRAGKSIVTEASLLRAIAAALNNSSGLSREKRFRTGRVRRARWSAMLSAF
jgi:hypothetical protein